MRASTAMACLVGVGAISAGCTLLNSGDDLLRDSGVRADAPGLDAPGPDAPGQDSPGADSPGQDVGATDAFAPTDAFTPCVPTSCTASSEYCDPDTGRCAGGMEVQINNMDGPVFVAGAQVVSMDDAGRPVSENTTNGEGGVKVVLPMGGGSIEIRNGTSPTTRYFVPGSMIPFEILHRAPPQGNPMPEGWTPRSTGCQNATGTDSLGPQCLVTLENGLAGYIDLQGVGPLDWAFQEVESSWPWEMALENPLPVLSGHQEVVFPTLSPPAGRSHVAVWANARPMRRDLRPDLVPLATSAVTFVLTSERSDVGSTVETSLAQPGFRSPSTFSLQPFPPTPTVLTRSGAEVRWAFTAPGEPLYIEIVELNTSSEPLRSFVLPGTATDFSVPDLEPSATIRFEAHWFAWGAMPPAYQSVLPIFGRAPRPEDRRRVFRRDL